jgi:hypothetical protein
MVGFERTISAGRWPQTHAIDHASTGTGWVDQCKIYTVQKLRALTKLFKINAKSVALIMVTMRIPVLDHAVYIGIQIPAFQELAASFLKASPKS